jgi:hypothetical protein
MVYITVKLLGFVHSEITPIEVHTGLWWGDLTERGHFEDTGIDVRIILRWIFMK